MSYGSKTTEDGAAIKADGASPILTGEQVPGNKIASLELAKGPGGEEIKTRALLTFQQSNGAKFTHTFWDSDQDWGIDQVNREMLHICSKIVTQDEYYDIIAEHASEKTFVSWIKAVSEHIITKAEGMVFTLKIIYKENKTSGKWYPNFPKFPNFIELDGTSPSTLSTNPKYDVYTQPTPESMGGGASNDSNDKVAAVSF